LTDCLLLGAVIGLVLAAVVLAVDAIETRRG
jgi:hypothetical protein